MPLMRFLILPAMLVVGVVGTTTLGAPIASAANAPTIEEFAKAAARDHGPDGAKAAAYLIAGMPAADVKSLSAEFLLENLRLALATRGKFPWTQKLPDDLFLDAVLPYAQLDEPRDPWRADFSATCGEIVKDCRSASEAAQELNRQLFKKLGVKYSTRRLRANQSPRESIHQGLASCTGLSIILANACRSVGIPARLAGTAMWTNRSGNHTWVEIWDGAWHFTGAAEPSPDGLNRGWFQAQAAKAVAGDPNHAIWANTWQPTPNPYPLVWNRANRSVSSVDVTARYTTPAAKAGDRVIYLRVVDDAGQREVARVELIDGDGRFLRAVTSKAGTTDRNDMPAIDVPPASISINRVLRVLRGPEARDFPLPAASAAGGEQVVELAWERGRAVAASAGMRGLHQWLTASAAPGPLAAIPPAPLSRTEASAAMDRIWDLWRSREAPLRAAELTAKVITLGDKSMRLKTRVFGEAPADGRSLWISLHGGGGAPAAVNDQQWQNQSRLYEPAEGVYIAPRAPTNTWNLWHQSHIDGLFDRLIENCVLVEGVNPNKVYLMGYSAGGDGVYQLAPRLADRFAAASMMAGHPNQASPLSLRNLPFAIFAGGKDTAYNRNRVAADWGAQLDALANADPGAYPHQLTIYPNLGHWMERKDAAALPWMASFTRDTWPRKIVWHQPAPAHLRFYWLGLPAGGAQAGVTIRASAEGNRITIDAPGIERLTLRLNDRLVDLDQAVQVLLNGKPVFDGKVTRQANAILTSLRQRADPHSAATALLEVGR